MGETQYAWQDTALTPRERAEKLVEAMTLEQKIAQLHGAMETIDIYALTRGGCGGRRRHRTSLPPRSRSSAT